MKHICVIGNSQVGALKQGYDSLNDLTYKASFFSIPGGGGPNLYIKNGLISIPEKFSMKVKTDIALSSFERFDISEYDAILLSGVGLPAIRKQNETVNRHYLAAGFIENRKGVDKQILSRDVFSILVKKAVNESPSFLNINKISSIFKKNIFVQQFPLPTPSVSRQPDFDLQCYGQNVGKFLSWYCRKQTHAMESSLNQENILILNYPKEWLEVGFTPIQYQSENDAWHMNKQFGAYFMGELLNAVL